MAQPQNQTAYSEMSVTKELRPILKSAGFKNFNRFKREQLAEICEEYDKVNQVRIRDIPHNHNASASEEDACHDIIRNWLQSKEVDSTTPAAAQSSSRTNTKRKQTEPLELPKGKCQKVSKRTNDETVGSDAEDRNGEADTRHVTRKNNVSKTSAQTRKSQTTDKIDEKRKRPLKSKLSSSRSGDPTSASGTSTTTKTSKTAKKSVAPKVTKQPVVPKTAKPSVASNAKPSQEPTRRSARNKKPMDTSQPSGEESHDSQMDMSEPAVSPAKAASARATNPLSATKKMEAEDHGIGPEDSSDDLDDDDMEVEDDGEDNSDDSDEEQRPPLTPKSPARRTAHNYNLGTHRTFRYTPQWDPLDDRIPTSSLNWFEQVQRQRARQAQLRKEA